MRKNWLDRPTFIHVIGEKFVNIATEFGAIAHFSWLAFLGLISRRPRWRLVIPSMYTIGVLSVPVVGITGMFIGMVLAIQAYNAFNAMGMASRLGSIVNISLVKELGPVLAATMLAGRVGSSMAAELGTMRVTEQIDALSALGANPIHFLVTPRLISCVILIPLLTLFADFMGVLGGGFVSIQMLGIDSFYYWEYSKSYVGALDIIAGLFKSFFFGAAIAIVSCQRGFHSNGGAEGVGMAATQAFVYSFIAILFLDFWLGYVWNQTYYSIWPGTAGWL